MREIKFRAWDKLDRVMLPHVQDYYDTLTERDGEPNQPEQSFGDILSKPERYVVMQFTGHKDKNGKEIYEGDVVRETSTHWDEVHKNLMHHAGIVEYVPCEFIISIRPAVSEYCPWSSGMPSSERDIEVIGNIHENPELLKENL